MTSYSYEQLKKIKIGQQFYESGQRGNILFTVKTTPVETTNGEYTQLSWVGSVKGGEDVNYLITKEAQHYSTNIYATPVYIGVPNYGF